MGREQGPGDSHRESVHLVGRRLRWQDAPPGEGGRTQRSERIGRVFGASQELQAIPPTRGGVPKSRTWMFGAQRAASCSSGQGGAAQGFPLERGGTATPPHNIQ